MDFEKGILLPRNTRFAFVLMEMEVPTYGLSYTPQLELPHSHPAPTAPPAPSHGRPTLPLVLDLCLWLLPLPIFPLVTLQLSFFVSYLNNPSLQRSKYFLCRQG